jgi:hypothetical protein
LLRLAALLLLAAALFGAARPASAVTARDLSGRIRIDGYTTEFTDSERVFGLNPDGTPQEASDDSKWGVNNDISQIRITWDAANLYIAGEGKIWGNNMILFIDSVQGQGLARMDSLNSWRRNFFFDPDSAAGFEPDLFVATWDNAQEPPHLITQTIGQTVLDNVIGAQPPNSFTSATTFSVGNSGRAMEAALPWTTVFRGHAMPRGAKLKICGVITGGGDGTGGPDSAPDNGQGLSSDGSTKAVIDNYAIIDLDRNTDIQGGAVPGPPGPDGIPDLGVEPISRVGFRFPPPIFPKSFCVKDIIFDRPALVPDRGGHMRFSLRLEPVPDPLDLNNGARKITMSAYVYDLRGRQVRTLYVNQARPVLAASGLAFRDYDVWDGRDQSGAIVPPGVYVVRIITEPGVCRALGAFAVVR